MTPVRRLMLAAASIAGLVGAHALDYALLIPDPEHRHDVLLRSGHGYLPFALAVAAIAALAALATAMVGGARGQCRSSHPALGMALVQGGGFVALEAVERIAAGARFDASVLAIVACGVVLQVVVALVAVRLLAVTARAGAALARALRVAAPRVPRALRAGARVERAAGRPRCRTAGAHTVRGPPPLLFA